MSHPRDARPEASGAFERSAAAGHQIGPPAPALLAVSFVGRQTLIVGWMQQLVSLGALAAFNLLIPLLAGLDAYGEYTAAVALPNAICFFVLGGYDLIALRLAARADEVDQCQIWLLLRGKLPSLVLLALLIVGLGPVIFPKASSPWLLGLWSGVFALTQGSSSLLVNAMLGARQTSGAVVVSMVLGVLYLIVPAGAVLLFGATGHVLTGAVAACYFLVLILEVRVLRALPARRGVAGYRSWSDVLLSGAPLWFDGARGGAAFYLASFWLSPSDLGIARVSFSLMQGVAALAPVPQAAITAVAKELKTQADTDEALTRTARGASLLCGVSGAAGIATVGILLYPEHLGTLVALTPAVSVGSAFAVLVRYRLGIDTGREAPRLLAVRLLPLAMVAGLLPPLVALRGGIVGFMWASAVLPATVAGRVELRALARSPLWLSSATILVAGVTWLASGQAPGPGVLRAALIGFVAVGYGGALFSAGGFPLFRRSLEESG